MLGEVSPYIGIMLTAILSGYVFYLKSRMNKQSDKYDELISSLNHELQAIGSGSMGVGRKLLSLEKQITELKNSQEEMVRNDPNRVSYTEATRLVELGAEVEDLMNSCGISRPEAELVTALSQRNQAKEVTVN